MRLTAALLAAFILFTAPAAMAQTAQGQTMDYKDGDVTLEGYFAKAQHAAGPAPVVLIVHQWKGLGAYEKHRADMLAALGYNAFAVDMYGKGVRPADNDAAGKEAGKYKNDPALARRRITAALTFARTLPGVDPSRVAVIGYCFGGTMALELARSGADIRAAISFHGGLATRAPAEKGAVKASIQVHHGADDPNVPQTEVTAFMTEMNEAGADWSLTQYAHAVHGFTEQDYGTDNSKGVAYNEKADRRSWAAAQAFLAETLKSQ